MKTQTFDTETMLELLTQTAIEQYILSGSEAEDTVCGLINIAEVMEQEGAVTAEQLGMLKKAIAEWKQEDQQIPIPEKPDALKVQDSIEWLEDFLKGKDNPILKDEKQFYIDYWMTIL